MLDFFFYEFKDCNFKSMRTTRRLPGKIVLFLAFQIIVVANLFAQNRTGIRSDHTFAPLPGNPGEQSGNDH